MIAVGPKVLEVKAGDQVLFGTYAGTVINDDGVELLVLHEKDVLAVVLSTDEETKDGNNQTVHGKGLDDPRD